MSAVEMSIAAAGVLADFNAAGLISPAGIHLERTLRRLGSAGKDPGHVGLAIAMTARALELGSACLPIAGAEELTALLSSSEGDDEQASQALAELVWPMPDQWLDELAASPLVTSGADPVSSDRPMRLVAGRLYFERVWQQQERLADLLMARLGQPTSLVDPQTRQALDQVFPETDSGQKAQRAAIEAALTNSTTVIAGGPGTGKTTSVQRLLHVLETTSTSPQRVALAALSGKAAARMKEALEDPARGIEVRSFQHVRLDPASTLHRLLGSRGRIGFEHGPHNPLPHDWVIVDEVSMISLPMMLQLLSSLRPTTRLVLLGDPDQLSSIEVGSVLADIVAAELPASAPPAASTEPVSGGGSQPAEQTADESSHQLSRGDGSLVSKLSFNYRFADHRDLVELAGAVRDGDIGRVNAVLDSPSSQIEFFDHDPAQLDLNSLPQLVHDLVECGSSMRAAAIAGDAPSALAALNSHRLLCANARGPYGVSHWTHLTERTLLAEIPDWGRRADGSPANSGVWYPGRPLLNTANSAELGIFNGDTGLLIEAGGELLAAMGTTGQHRLINPYLLEDADTMHALTIHKSQGSQYDCVTLILPPAGSRILTRELLYTGLTRAMDRVRIIGTRSAIEAATLTPARRASGLTQRLRAKVESVSLGSG